MPVEALEVSSPAQENDAWAAFRRNLLRSLAVGLLALLCIILDARWSLGTPDLVPGHGGARHVVTLASWNLAGINFTSAAELSRQMLEFGADIVLTQEDVEYPQNAGAGIAMNGYRRAGACRAEELWDVMKEYKDGGRFLQNAIYVREGTIQVVRSFAANLSDTSTEPRCAIFVDFLPAGFPLGEQLTLRVASTHLTGGRFVDTNWRRFAGEKPKQVQSVLRWDPDVAGGDMNSYASATEADSFQKTYQPYKDAEVEGSGREYLGYATGGVDEFERGGMYRLPLVGETTTYGGMVDHFFVRRCPRISYVDSSSKIVGDFKSSDHKAVVASFHIAVDALTQ